MSGPSVREVEQQLRAVMSSFDAALLSVADAGEMRRLFTSIKRLAEVGELATTKRVADTSVVRTRKDPKGTRWAGRQLGVSDGQAAALLELAEQLEQLPGTREALEHGRISREQAAEIARTASEVPDAETTLLEVAPRESLVELKRRAGRLRAGASGAEARLRALRAKRYLRTWTDTEGAGRGSWLLPPELQVQVLAYLRPFHDQVFHQAREEGRRESSEAYAADALIAMGLAANDADHAPGERSEPSEPDVESSPLTGQAVGGSPPGGQAVHGSPPGRQVVDGSPRAGQPDGRVEPPPASSGAAAPDPAARVPSLDRATRAALSPMPSLRTADIDPSPSGGGGRSPEPGSPPGDPGRGTESAALEGDARPRSPEPGSLPGDPGRGPEAAALEGNARPRSPESGSPPGDPGCEPEAAALEGDARPRPPGPGSPPSEPGSRRGTGGSPGRVVVGGPPDRDAGAGGRRANRKKARSVVAERMKILVRVDHTALQRGEVAEGEVCEVVGIGPVPVESVREWIGQGAFVAALLTEGQDVKSVVHMGRSPTALQRTVLEWEQPECHVLGCPARDNLQVDHAEDWSRTRHTTLSELDRYCPDHHRMKTHDGYRLEPGRGKRRFLSPAEQADLRSDSPPGNPAVDAQEPDGRPGGRPGTETDDPPASLFDGPIACGDSVITVRRRLVDDPGPPRAA